VGEFGLDLDCSTAGLTVGEVLLGARRMLGSETSLSAQVLLSRLLGRNRSWLLAHSEFELTAHQRQAFRQSVDRLAAGEPLPYLLGEWEFYGRKFDVGESVLIPRPETELMMERALQLGTRARRILDLGTGSGCVAVSLALELPEASVLATDRSLAALQMVQVNARRYGVSNRVMLIAADLLAALDVRFELICANLPYIPSGRLIDLEVARHEPREALDGGPDGMQLIRRALADLPRVLAKDGAALFEIDAAQADVAAQLAQTTFPSAAIRTETDLAGHQRLLVIENG
jgi:release factor glutamine methyltransferase